jgi:pilus assembly protein CpaC
VSTKAGFIFAFLGTLSLGVCGELGLQGQTAAPPQPAAGAATQDSSNDLYVSVGKSVLVDSAHQITKVALGSGDIAEATAVSPSEIMVNGKAAGETTLIIWETGGGRQFFNVKVSASIFASNDRMDSLRRELRTELPGQTVKVSSENGLVFLRGTVKDLNASDRAVQIASTAGKVVNLLYVNVPPPAPQILLKVRFASVDRTLSKQLGINIFSLGAANTIGSITTQQFNPPGLTGGGIGNGGSTGGSTSPTATLSNLLNIFIYRPDLNLGAAIKALEAQGVVQMLAEPNLLTANGKEASFLAGGQYPYPVVQGVSGSTTAAVTIQFQEFGVRLRFIPTVTPRGTIHLQVAPEVSSLDYANGVTISGFTVPALEVRKVKTDVELAEGQSFVIGGLLDNRVTQNLSKIPFLGDIPVLGKFFQSIDKTRSNTELIVIVTPEIVAPIPVGAPVPSLKYPDAFLPSNSNIPMTNPGASVTGAQPIPAAPATMPVEELIQSMKAEKPLGKDNEGGSYSGGGGSAMPPPSTSQ